MDSLTAKLRTGQIKIKKVPLPILQKGCVLVRNHYSLISSGTEASTVMTARKGFVGKAKERPQQLQQLIKTTKTQGPLITYRAVMKKLEGYSPLGYSSAGEIIETAPTVTDLKVGDRVACAGLSASHAEVVCVPRNLCVRLKPDTDLKQAAYNALGSIALHSIRQANLQIADSCAVIGLGLIGQITSLLLKASGIKVIGIDINSEAIKTAQKNSCDLAFERNAPGIIEKIFQFTDGIGCDAVIIAAASASHDPINFAGAISRKKGSIIIVGAIPTGFDREPYFYKKELTVKMSCSYGPGRYDPNYEAKGLDYPHAYVRWTENRNMNAFQNLIYTKAIDVSYLTTHVFKLDEAAQAYELLIQKSEPFMGILIEYDTSKRLEKEKININRPAGKVQPQSIAAGFFGAGSYAQNYLLPNIISNHKISLKGIMTASGTSSRSAAERYGFEFCTDNEEDIFNNSEINTIFIATRHDSHARLVLKALKAGKHAFVEKPLCLKREELDQIILLLKKLRKQHESKDILIYPSLMVGYNRRFSPISQTIKETFAEGPMAMIYRINAGSIPADSWIQDAEFGGGRILGEICHFVDFMSFINGSLPTSVYARTMEDSRGINDTVNICLTYNNGSLGSISYFANGDSSVPKERCEIYCNGCVALVDDFKKLSIHADGKRKGRTQFFQDKGQKAMLDLFVKTIMTGGREPIRLEDIIATSMTTFKIIESIQSGQTAKI